MNFEKKITVLIHIIMFFLPMGGASHLLAGPPWTILSLGDSITMGAVCSGHQRSGYREPLYQALIKHSQSVLMVGPTDIASSGFLINANQQYHAGFSGYGIAELDANLDGDYTPPTCSENRGGYWITGKPGLRPAIMPDIILLMAGTNDLGRLLVGADVAIRRLDHLLSRLYALCPQTHVIVAKIPPMFNSLAVQVAKFNSKVEEIANQYSLNNFKISVVDQYTPFLGTPFSDGVHPYNEIYSIMANQWLPKILEAIHLKEQSLSE